MQWQQHLIIQINNMSKASLIVGNSNWAIKDSSLLGYNINDSNIYSPFPFDVTRATPATRVDKDGLIVTDTEILSGELITNGDFATDSNWNLPSNLTITNGVAVANGVTSGQQLWQSFSSIGTYKVEFTISNFVSGGCKPIFHGGTFTGSSQVSSNGTFVQYITVTSTPSRFSIQFIGLSSVMTIDNISVIEVNRNNLARIDYSDSTKGVLLTEPQSTNLVTYSQDFSDSSWDKDSGIIVSSSNNVSPSGLKDATEISVSNNGRIYINLSSANYTGSIFIKKGTFAYFKFSGVNIDLIAKTTSNANANLTEMSNGWFRIAYNIGSSSRPIQVQAYPDNTYSAHSDSGNYYIWGAQAEILPYATSIIPTSGSTVTRNQDLVTNESITSLSGSYTVFAHYDSYSNITGGSLRDWQSASNKVYLIYNYGGGLDVFNNSSFIVDRSTLVSGTNFKIAIVTTPTTVKVFINGVDRTKAGATPNLTPITKWSNDGNLSQKAKSLKFYNTALSDSELITLTTI